MRRSGEHLQYGDGYWRHIRRVVPTKNSIQAILAKYSQSRSVNCMLNWLQSIAYLIYGFALLRAALMAQGAALHQQFIVLADEHKSTSFNPHRSIVIDSTLWITPPGFLNIIHILCNQRRSSTGVVWASGCYGAGTCACVAVGREYPRKSVILFVK